MQQTFENLTKLIQEYDKIIIMSHKNMDLDAFGSSLCLYNIVKAFNKECYIYLNQRKINETIKRLQKLLEKEQQHYEMISYNKVKKLVDQKTLLIVLDTHIPLLVENDKLLKLIKDIVVIDHHIIQKNMINKTKMTYIDSNLSSVVEFMVEYLKYLGKGVSPLIATIMLAGIEIDTNDFKVKTTEKTYEAAAYLTSLGADNVIKQELQQETKDEYLKIKKDIEKSEMINDNTILCIIHDIVEKRTLAKVAEELLKFENVGASYAIGQLNDNTVGVSARSLGNVNVYEVCKELGGGGHLSNAAAQIEGLTILEVKEKIVNLSNGVIK
ncbi:MAG: hypothetical protein GX247_00245 [Mollicutes bacterium]|nr:hypothetical protein [Mollicutes bacterium]